MEKIYDKIRMLDTNEYPKAFINFGKYTLEFTNANFKNNELKADVRFLRKKNC